MAHWVRRLALAAVLLGLAGCSTGMTPVPYDRTSVGDIKTIGILTPAFPEGPKVILASTVGQSFGLIGALVDAGMQSHRDSAFTSLLASQNYSAKDAFSLKLGAALKAQGYQVEFIPVTRPEKALLHDYHVATNIKVDAYLDVAVFAYGYIAAGVSGSDPYRPVFGLICRLVRVSDQSVLMQDGVIYNPVNPGGASVTLSPNPEYEFVDFDSLTADAHKTTAGLDDALTQSADAVAKLLH